MAEFLLAVIAILDLWSQVGGQGHLDLMPWYAKRGFTVGLGLVIAMGTASAINSTRTWNTHTMAWLLLALALVLAMGAETYYIHLHEDDGADSSYDNGVAG
jgi:cell division protein FtsW (lipid II flippase)